MQQTNSRKWNNTEATNQPAAANYIPVSLADGTAAWVPFSSMGGGTDLTDAIIKAPGVSGRNLITHPTAYAGLELLQTSIDTTSPTVVLKYKYGASTLTGMTIYPNRIVFGSATEGVSGTDQIVRISASTHNTHAIAGYTANTSGSFPSAGVYGRGDSTGNFGVVGEAISPAAAGVKGTAHGLGIGVFGTGAGIAGLFQKSNASGTKPTLVAKRIASQTSNLQEWQDESGNVLASIDANGGFSGGSVDRREWWSQQTGNGVVGVGLTSPFTETAASANIVDDSTGLYQKATSAATTDANAGWNHNGYIFTTNHLPSLYFAMKTGSSIATCRILVGSFSDDPMATATPSNCIGFRYDTSADGTAYWRTYTHDFSTSLVSTTSVPVATNTRYVFKIVYESSSSVGMYINGTLVDTITTNLPYSGFAMYQRVMIRTLENVAKEICFSKVGGTAL